MAAPPSGSSASASSSTPGAEGQRCANCGAQRTGGRFCSSCGAPFEGALCAACRSALTAGAKFCHRCGTAVGAMPSGTRPGGRLWPWALTSAALLVLVLFMVGRNIGVGTTRAQSPAEGPSDASTAADPKAAADAPFADGPAAGTPGDAVRAPDISALSPEERADRLFDRVMRLAEQGKRDSVEFFSPMVMSAYQMLGSLNADQHYDLGRIGEVTGVPDLARAEADTILRAHPTHLLGLSLAARVARAAKQDAAARDYYRRLAAAAPTELRKSLPEYTRHRRDIDAALAAATELGISRP